MSDRPIPALVVSGFLGSGKTTLVRQLLDHAQRTGARVAFVSNELGELGVDQAMLGGGQEAFVELVGGCVCCALNDDLYDTLIMLKEKVDPDRIVIETSGVAIPHDVQITFYQPPIRDWISEEAVVVVVNAEQMLEGRDLGQTFTEQLESADLVVLHKIDLVAPDVLPDLKAHIERINPGVAVVSASHGRVDPRLLLAERGPREVEPEHGHDHQHEAFEALEIQIPPGLSAAEVERLLRAEGALRTKGFVELDSGTHLVQGVGRRIELVPPPAPVAPDRIGRVVVIRRTGA